MNRISPPADEHTVVAFLSGIDAQRDEAALILVQSPDARELLCMAQEALDALGLSSTPSPAPTHDPGHAEA